MPQSNDEGATTTATLSVHTARAAKIYAAQNGTSIRAIIDLAVPAWIKLQATNSNLQEAAGVAKG